MYEAPQYPVNYISIPQGFGSGHKGIDFGWFSALHHNQPILAVADGVVIYIKKQASGGNVIHIRHKINGEYFVSEYGHLKDNSIRVKLNQKVSRNEQIAKMGATGKVTAEHLHFGLCKGEEIHYNASDKWVNPLDYLEVYRYQTVGDKAKKEYGNKIKYHVEYEVKYVCNVDDEGLVVHVKPNGKETGELLKAGTQVEVYETQNKWSKIGDNKWVYSAYLSKTKPKTKTVTGVKNPPLNVRNKPSTSGKVVGALKNGDVVQVYKTKSGWSKVSKDEERWCASSYLK